MRRLRLIQGGFATALIFAGGAGGCSDDIDREEAAGVVAGTVCSNYFGCGCEEFNDSFTSAEQCRAEQEGEYQRAIDEGEAAGLIYDGDCVERLVDELDDLGCTTLSGIETGDLVRLLESQQCKLFYGERTGGQSCDELELSDGDDCVRDHQCDDGICKRIEPVPGPGEPCDIQYISPCTGDAVCVDLDEDGENRCEQLPAAGETCLGIADLCSAGTYCDQGSKTCTQAPAAGEACAPGILDQNRCSEGTTCDDGTCVALPTGGESCVQGRCAEGFTCAGGTCAAEAPLVCGADVVSSGG